MEKILLIILNIHYQIINTLIKLMISSNGHNSCSSSLYILVEEKDKHVNKKHAEE